MSFISKRKIIIIIIIVIIVIITVEALISNTLGIQKSGRN